MPEPLTRGAALPGDLPDVLVDLDAYDARCVLHAGAVRTAPWTPDQLARAQVHVHLSAPALLAPDVLADAVARLADRGEGRLTLVDGDREVGVVPPRDDLAGFLAAPWQPR